MRVAQVDITESFQEGLTTVVNIVPALLAFLAILVIGYIVARLLAKGLDAILDRVGFDRAVERGGIRRAMARTEYDASDILSRIVFYALMLFVLQLAFSVFGPNAISDLLAGVIAFLPRLFVAIVIVVIAAAVAAAVREIVVASIGGLSYGRIVGNLASGAIVVIGVFAALNQLQIAPAIVNGLFYALLAIVAGSAIVAIGGGGIGPMRRQWERAMGRIEEEAPRVREHVTGNGGNGGRTQEVTRRTGEPEPRGASRADQPPRASEREDSLRTEAENASPPGRRHER